MDFNIYLPIDRRLALAGRLELPELAAGAVLFADIAGFTPLAEALRQSLGTSRGAEELTALLNRTFASLTDQVHRFGGSTISFAGDGITCWFAGDDGRRALCAALAMHEALREVTAISLKIAIVSGPVRRFVVGDPALRQFDILAGRTIVTLAVAAALARSGETLVSAEIVAAFGGDLTVAAWRGDGNPGGATGAAFALVAGLASGATWAAAAERPWPAAPPLGDEIVGRWLPAAVYQRLRGSRREFASELRPTVALFLRLATPDYDGDARGVPGAAANLDAYVRRVQRTADRYGGTLIDVIIGDKGSYLYLSFGAPVAHDDDASRALAVAHALMAVPPELAALGRPQIGIASGLTYAGTYGGSSHSTYGVIGEQVNLAARLMELAPPGDIRCDHETYRAAQSAWHFDLLPAMRVKGRASLVRAYRPTRLRTQREPAPAAGLVGRRAELRRCDEIVSAVNLGDQRILVIAGDSGSGKSRLMDELIRMARERNIAGLLGAGQSMARQTPYRIWRAMLNDYFDLAPGDAPAARCARIEAVVREIAPEHADRLSILNEIMAVRFPEPVPIDPYDRQRAVEALILALLRAWARERPLALLIEDAHWLDSRSWRLTLQVARGLAGGGEPFLLAVTSRPPAADEPSSIRPCDDLQVGPPCDLMALAPLPQAALESLVAGLFGVDAAELPRPIADLLRERAGGNPLFAEELAHTLRERRLIELGERPLPDGGSCRTCRIAGGADLAQIPATLPELARARIDWLPAERARTLKIAAVIGHSFSLAPLHALVSRSGAIRHLDLVLQLDEMRHRRLTFQEETHEERTYGFRHAIIREAAYAALPPDQRRELHAALAGWYEATLGAATPWAAADLSQLYDLLAYHYRAAELPEAERRYAELAGRRAAAQLAEPEAQAYVRRVAELGGETISDDP